MCRDTKPSRCHLLDSGPEWVGGTIGEGAEPLGVLSSLPAVALASHCVHRQGQSGVGLKAAREGKSVGKVGRKVSRSDSCFQSRSELKGEESIASREGHLEGNMRGRIVTYLIEP